MPQQDNRNLIEHFLKYQAIYGLIVYMVASWTLYGAKIESIQEALIKQEARIEANAINGAEINSRLASIETSLEFIKLQYK